MPLPLTPWTSLRTTSADETEALEWFAEQFIGV